ncbi:AAA family ATPase [Nocardioides sp. Leaf285]|uniref:AAA family ATPase n=1 Tax=Nocardioides sp. Leaf285 TaxID=1736322 RepID=UPI0007024088|nr:AAA family ATPase [Nocardioides sp. Leaf285]KQP62953.1 AAA family ATPase [Nocardioides sp. Leaf285]
MRNPLDNPFTPGADAVPRVWAGRVQQLQDYERILRPRRIAGLSERGRTILGEAGLGKSTLVRRIADIAREAGDWVTPQLRVPVGSDPLKTLAAAMLDLAASAGLPARREERIGQTLARVRTVAVSGVSLSLERGDGPEPYTALTDLLVEIGLAAIERDCAVLIHVDEIQNITSEAALSQLLVCLGDALAFETIVTAPGDQRIKRVLPIAVYLTGLPEFADMAGARKGATFARRFATTRLAPIDDDDLRLALHEFIDPGFAVPDEQGGTTRVTMEQAAIEEIVAVCCGEPFLFQLAGERAWYEGEGPLITAAEVRAGWVRARDEAESHVERILARLPARERQFLDAMAELEPAERTATKIAKAAGHPTAAAAGPYAQRLDTIRGIIDRGSPYTFRHRAIEAYLTTDWPRT